MKKSIDDLQNVQGKTALVRVDINAPLDADKNVTDDTRLLAIIPTLKKLKELGLKIVLMAHLGRPKGVRNLEFSLEPVCKRLSELIGEKITFVSDCVGDVAEAVVKTLKDGEIALLENVRFYGEETKNDPEFSAKLAKMGDIYVNDAFGAAHRAHSSTAGVAKILPVAVSGYLMEKELKALGGLLENPQRPFTAIVGGAKISSKIGVLENLLDKVDNLIVGGGMAYTFVKANGGKIGSSICEDDQMDVARAIEAKAKEKGVNLIMATDVLVADDFSNEANTKVVPVSEIEDGFEGVDAGPETVKAFEEVIKNSKTILWNGPVGAFEIEKFTSGTRQIAAAVAEATKAGAVSVLGGGDTVAAAKKYGYTKDDFSHISTGGGASLEFIEGKVLPGVDALNDK